MFSIVTVESSTRMPTASARPPSVMVLSVCPSAASTAIEVRIDSGMEIRTTTVERHEPRKTRIISPARAAAIKPSRSTPVMAPVTKTDWSNSRSTFMPLGAAAWMPGMAALTALTTDKVEASPFLMIVKSTDALPSVCTTFCCTAQPSRTWATSLSSTVTPPTWRTGTPFSDASDLADESRLTIICLAPILTSPEGSVRLWALTAVTTSLGVTPFARMASGSRSTMICRNLPPYGVGSVRPGIGANACRIW